jgi:hypothetical protein
MDELITFHAVQHAPHILPGMVLKNHYGEDMGVAEVKYRASGFRMVLYIARRDGATMEPYLSREVRDTRYGWQVTVNVTASRRELVEIRRRDYPVAMDDKEIADLFWDDFRKKAKEYM